jgi:hypothetical protein
LKIFVDIDETICTGGDPLDYSTSVPKREIIERINSLYNLGHIIIYWTARGGTTGIDWRKVTEEQLNSWGAKYHSLRLDKPVFDLFIDDKVVTSDEKLLGKLDSIIKSKES